MFSLSCLERSWDAMKAKVAYLSLDVALNLPRLERADIPASFETSCFYLSAACWIHGSYRAASADGLLSLSLVNNAVMNSLPLSEIEAHTGSENENLPILTFFIIS